MQRSSFVAVLSIMFLTAVPACGPKDDDKKTDAGKTDAAKADDGEAKADAGGAEAEVAQTTTPVADTGEVAAAEAGAAEAGAAEAGAAEAGEVDAAEAGEAEAEAGAAEAGAAEAGAAEAGEAQAGVEDPVPALFESAKSLDTDDDAAKQALADALAAGASKLDAAKAANERGLSLLVKGESERAEVFFTWALEKHSKYADPAYNLAKLAAYAGDLELAKEHLAELEKRGNKMLMKKVGVEGAFAPLHDDPDVRKIYER